MKHEWRFFVRTRRDGSEFSRGRRCQRCLFGIQMDEKAATDSALAPLLDGDCFPAGEFIRDFVYETAEERDACAQLEAERFARAAR